MLNIMMYLNVVPFSLLVQKAVISKLILSPHHDLHLAIKLRLLILKDESCDESQGYRANNGSPSIR